MEKAIEVSYDASNSMIMMRWSREIDKCALEIAFQKIMEHLEASPCPLYIIVDLSANPRFPTLETILQTVKGAYQHPKVAGWLVLKANPIARTIATVLAKTTGIKSVLWFNTQEEIDTYLENVVSC